MYRLLLCNEVCNVVCNEVCNKVYNEVCNVCINNLLDRYMDHVRHVTTCTIFIITAKYS